MRGFTLIEVVVVLVVLSIVAAVAVVALPSLTPPARSDLAASLTRAREEAVTRGETVRWRRDSVTISFHADGSASGGRYRVDGVEVTVDALTGAARASP